MWTLAGRLRAVREDRCDDRVMVALGIAPLTYCRVLLDVAAALLRLARDRHA